MPKHNNVIPNAHFRKNWARRVKTWFDQPAKKKSRRIARKAKAAAIAPRPVAGLLRPVVRCPTHRYNIKVRTGRGFTVAELKAAKISKKVAKSIGIAVDHRRRNTSAQSVIDNSQRLDAYKSKLIVLPRRGLSPKQGDSPKDLAAKAVQLTGPLFPVSNKPAPVVFTSVTEEAKAKNAYATLRQERCNARMAGKRAKKAKEAAETATAAPSKKGGDE